MRFTFILSSLLAIGVLILTSCGGEIGSDPQANDNNSVTNQQINNDNQDSDSAGTTDIAGYARQPGMLWYFTKDNAINRTISIGSNGTQVFGMEGNFSNYIADLWGSIATANPVPFMEQIEVLDTRNLHTASAKDDDYHAVLFDLPGASGQQSRRPHIRLIDPSTAANNWDYVWPNETLGTDQFEIRIAGGKIIAAIQNVMTAKIDVKMFIPSSNIPVAAFAATMNEFNNMEVSADGSSIFLAAGIRANIYNLPSGNLRHSQFFWSTIYATAFSGDGNAFAFSELSGITIVKLNTSTNQFVTSFTYAPGGAYYSGGMAFSDDGTTLVVPFSNAVTHVCLITTFDLTSNSPIRSYSVDGVLNYSNSVVTNKNIAVSQHGERTVVGIEGDGGLAQTPELLLFKRDQDAPLATYQTSGSPFGVAISADGKFAAARGKMFHNNIFSTGTWTTAVLVDRADLFINSIPHANSTASFEVYGPPGSTAFLFRANNRGNSPNGNHGFWCISNDRTVVGSAIIDSSGRGLIDYLVPNNIGTTHYFQALTGSDRHVSGCADMTIVP